MPQIETLTPETLQGFLSSPVAVLILTKSDCAACAAWAEELGPWLASLPEDAAMASARYGKLVLNQPGLSAFKKASPWLREVRDLPYNAIYADGEPARGFVGSGVKRLENRLRRVLP